MCLLIHKPENTAIPEHLLDSAAEFNPHGFGLMAFSAIGGLVIRRRSRTSKPALHKLYEEFSDQECVIHLRYGTSGIVDFENTHPIRITKSIYMAHNGTLNMARHEPERSDTWHLVNDYLRPVLGRRPQLLHERFFHELMLTWCGPHNKFVFMDASTRQTVVINRAKGFETDGIWLSNTRWFDASGFPGLRTPPVAREAGFQALFSI